MEWKMLKDRPGFGMVWITIIHHISNQIASIQSALSVSYHPIGVSPTDNFTFVHIMILQG